MGYLAHVGVQCKKVIMIDEHIPKYRAKNIITNWKKCTKLRKGG